MTYASRTAKRTRRPVFYLQIDGVEPILVEDTIAPASLLDSRTQIAAIESIQPGESRLDVNARREQGATLSLTVRDTTAIRAIFRPRQRRTTYLVTTIAKATAMSGAGTVNVKHESLFGTSGTIYIGGETFTFTGNTGAALTGVTRSLYGSRAQLHAGGTNEGANVYEAPVSWQGRRAKLKQVFLDEDDQGGASAADIGTVMSLRFEGPPVLGDEGLWELRLSELTEFYSHRRCYVGLREVKLDTAPEDLRVTSAGVITLPTREAALFKVGLVPTYARVTFDQPDGYTQVMKLTAAGASSATVQLGVGPVRNSRGTVGGGGYVGNLQSLQHVAYLTGDPAEITLMLLLSQLGDGANHATYDALPGTDRTSFGGEQWRMGAGFDVADIDVTAFEALMGGGGPTWTVFLQRELDVGALLYELGIAKRCYFLTDDDGLLTVKRLQDRATVSDSDATILTIDDDRIDVEGTEGISTDPVPVAHSVNAKMNWDPIADKHLFEHTVVDWDLLDENPEAHEAISIESAFMSVDSMQFAAQAGFAQTLVRSNPMQVDDLALMLRRIQRASARPRTYLTAPCGWQDIATRPGDIVKVTNDRLPDLEGGTLDGAFFLVVGREFDFERGAVSFRLMALDRGFRLAPVGVVTAWDAGTKTLTLSTTDDTNNASPGLDFVAGWDVYIADTSPTPNVLEAEEIASVTASTIVLVAAPSGFTPAAGDLVFPKYDVLNVELSTPGYNVVDMTWLVADGGTIDGTDDGTRWA